MARIDFRKALNGEMIRQRVFPVKDVSALHKLTVDVPNAMATPQSGPAMPPHTTPARDPMMAVSKTKRTGRPFWLRLLRAPLTAPRRFLVGALHLKIDGIIARQEAMQISTSVLQSTINSNQASIIAFGAMLGSINEALRTEISSLISKVTSISDSIRAEVLDLNTTVFSNSDSIRAEVLDLNTTVFSNSESIQAKLADLNSKIQLELGSLNADFQDRFVATSTAIRDLQEIFVAGALAERMARVEGIAVNRLHEIDIKIRGPHAFDDQTDAIRLNDGYVLVPKSAAKLRILLADAPADGLEPGTAKVIRKLLQVGMTAIDVGANVGALSLTCARAVGPTGKVFAFEPEPALAALLLKTFDLNGVPWVRLSHAAVSRAAGIASFHVSPISGHSSLYPLPSDEQPDETLIEVETCRLDDAIDMNQTVDLVKMDVEGAELDVLAGMTDIIERNPEIAVIAEFGASHLVMQGIDANDWIERFRSAGFTLFAINESTGNCKIAAASDILKVDSVNLAMAKPGSHAYRILAHSP